MKVSRRRACEGCHVTKLAQPCWLGVSAELPQPQSSPMPDRALGGKGEGGFVGADDLKDGVLLREPLNPLPPLVAQAKALP